MVFSGINAIADNLSNYSSAILLFFFLISSNYLGGLYSCSIKRLLEKRWVVHILAVVTMYVSVVNANATGSSNLAHQVGMSLALYGVFVAMTKGKLVYNLVIIGLLVGVYLMTQYINNYAVENDQQAENLNTYRSIRSLMLVGLVVSCVVGTAKYYMNKKSKFASGFNFLTFWLGTDDCSPSN